MGDKVYNSVDYINEHVKNLAKKQHYKSYDFKITEEFAKGENYLGEIRRAILNGIKDDGKTETLKLIIKTLPPSIKSKTSDFDFPIEKVYKNEIYLYNTYLPIFVNIQSEAQILDEDVKFKFAKCYYTSEDMLMFEDLNERGFKLYNRMESLDFDHMILAIKTIANVHALSFAAKNKFTKEEYNQHMDNIYQVEINKDLEKYMRASVDKMVTFVEAEDNRMKMKKFSEGCITKEYEEALNFDRENKYNIITHGDFWINNFMFKYEEGKPVDMILLDWQIPKLASPVIDLLYLLYISMDENMRDKYWDLVLDTYYDFFKTRLLVLGCDPEDLYPEVAFREDMKKYHGFAIINSIIMLPLVLNNKEDSVDLNDMLEGGVENFTNVLKYSNTFRERFNGVVRNLIKHNVL